MKILESIKLLLINMFSLLNLLFGDINQEFKNLFWKIITL